MEKHIDAHCHVFNKDILSFGARFILHALKIGEIARILDILHLDKLLKKLENLIHFLDIGINNNTEEMYIEMQKTYNNNYIITPLMLDLTYASGNTKTKLQKSLMGEEETPIHTHLQNTIKDYSSSMKKQLEQFTETEQKEINEKLKELDNKVDLLVDKFKLFSNDDDNARVFSSRNFQIQLKQLKELKKNYQDTVYPFLSVDPRKKGILEIVKQQVGKDKDFIGIKLYSPLGYSPTDPVLYGKSDTYNPKEDCLYNFCLQNDIPITAHCSDAGFATLNNSVKVNGYIYNASKNEIEYVNKTIIFKKKIDFMQFRFDSGAIEERAMILNHPKIWNKVLDKFNNLRLNLAHFGGAGQLQNLIKHNDGEKVNYETYSWAETILSYLTNTKYKNFYTDLSCFTEENGMTLSLFKKKLFDPNKNIQNNILYGSDFYLNMIFTDSFNTYLNMFTSEFGDSFNQISIENNKSFLKFS